MAASPREAAATWPHLHAGPPLQLGRAAAHHHREGSPSPLPTTTAKDPHRRCPDHHREERQTRPTCGGMRDGEGRGAQEHRASGGSHAQGETGGRSARRWVAALGGIVRGRG